MRVAALVIAALLLAGCFRDAGDDAGPVSPSAPTGPGSSGPPLRFGGRLVDAATGEALAAATVRLDLAQTLPCMRQGVGWRSWEIPVANGTFGPLEVPRPRSDDVAFFLHAYADGHSENATFIGPTEARGDIGNLTVRLHPDASVSGRAPPGTLLALDAPGFPRVAVADANGTFRFAHARVADAAFVGAVDVPLRTTVRAPAEVDVAPSEARGWTLEGAVRSPTGAPLAADVVAWNGTTLWSVARASDAGAFAMPLPPEPAQLRIEARTADGHHGGVLTLDVRGPPALKETILARELC